MHRTAGVHSLHLRDSVVVLVVVDVAAYAERKVVRAQRQKVLPVVHTLSCTRRGEDLLS